MPRYSSPSTSETDSERYPHDRSTSSTPWCMSQSSMNDRNGRPARGMTGFATVRVSGRRRVPSPPASTSACMSAADPLVFEAGTTEQLGVEKVAPVDDQRVRHPLHHLARPVEIAELGPLGYEHDRVGALECFERGARQVRIAEHRARALARDRVVCADVRALALQASGEDETRRL